jgi:hypothetical protein
VAQRSFEMLFHPTLRLLRIFGGNGGSDGAKAFG